jgi:Putative transposase of IS4/5 family (DUF4096)
VHANFGELRHETVWKGVLRYSLGRIPSMRKAYQSDLSDTEWSFLEPLLPVPHATGRPKMHSTREVLNAIFYIVRGG